MYCTKSLQDVTLNWNIILFYWPDNIRNEHDQKQHGSRDSFKFQKKKRTRCQNAQWESGKVKVSQISCACVCLV